MASMDIQTSIKFLNIAMLHGFFFDDRFAQIRSENDIRLNIDTVLNDAHTFTMRESADLIVLLLSLAGGETELPIQSFHYLMTRIVLEKPKLDISMIVHSFRGPFTLPFVNLLQSILTDSINKIKQIVENPSEELSNDNNINESTIDILQSLVSEPFEFEKDTDAFKATSSLCQQVISDVMFFENQGASDFKNILENEFTLRIRLLGSLVWFLVAHHEQFDLVTVIESLVGLLQKPYVQGKASDSSLFDLVFDLTAILVDHLPKSKQKSASQILQKANINDMPSKFAQKLSTLMPFRLTNLLIEDVVSTESSETAIPIFESTAKPWDWIEVGIETTAILVPWNNPDALLELNTSCISLDKFGARRCRQYINSFENTYNHGWRPLITSTNETDEPKNSSEVSPEVQDSKPMKRSNVDELVATNVKKRK